MPKLARILIGIVPLGICLVVEKLGDRAATGFNRIEAWMNGSDKPTTTPTKHP